MKRPVVLLAVAASLGLTACVGGGGKAPPAYVCENDTVAREAAPPNDTPLPPEQAGEIAKQEVATSETRTPDGRVPLVTVEQTGGVPAIVSTPVASPEEGEAVAEAAAADGDLVIVEVDEPVSATVTNDDDYGLQYAFANIQFEATWAFFNGGVAVPPAGPGAGSGQVVGVLDTGVDQGHIDLTSTQVLNGQTFQIGFAPPLEYPGAPGGTTDPNGHGTFLAGIIAALTNNDEGIAGAAPAARILPVQVLNPNGQGNSSTVANGIYWAIIEGGATVINLSLGGPNASQALQSAIQWAVHARQVPVIVSAGNSGRCGEPSYPGAFAETLAVGATNAGNGWAGFSTTGPYVDIAAPGDDIRSTVPGGYDTRDGTSFASPYVAAAAAIVRATHLGFRAADVYNYLMFTAIDLGPGGWDPFFGHGLLDVYAAATTP